MSIVSILNLTLYFSFEKSSFTYNILITTARTHHHYCWYLSLALIYWIFFTLFIMMNWLILYHCHFHSFLSINNHYYLYYFLILIVLISQLFSSSLLQNYPMLMMVVAFLILFLTHDMYHLKCRSIRSFVSILGWRLYGCCLQSITSCLIQNGSFYCCWIVKLVLF